MTDFTTTSYLSALLWLSTHVSTAPPLTVPFPAPLSATTVATLFAQNTSLSAISTFPPFPPPPILHYHIPDSAITLKFERHAYIPTRNESDVQKVLEDVIMDSVGYTDRTAAIPEHERVWERGDIVLWLEPDREELDQQAVLTWGLWTTALRGVRGYIRAYPGLFFLFEIFVGGEGVLDRWLVGFGSLTRYVGSG